ncbi:MAG: glycosyltransferase family 2 protein [Thermoplasmata archaeon]|nr:MAG: glycosyltransferase family 2 protein [Thermoplasmata archaeon]
MAKAKEAIGYSVVIPVFNEGKNIIPLYKELKPVMDSLGKKYEIIFIDDGSRDKTYRVIRRIYKIDNTVKAIKLRKNFGQTAAISAGFDHSKGKVIITMDGDLQNDPKDIPKLIAKINKGYDIVSGWRFNRKDPALSKKVPSKMSNRMARRLTKINLHDFGCTLKAYRRESIEDIELYGEMHRYIPAIAAWRGFSVTEVKVNHRRRKYGITKYGTGRLLHGFLDLLNLKFWSDYSTRPLHFFGKIGALSLAIGFIISIYKLIMRFVFGEGLQVGPLLIFAVMLIILGVQLIMFGFLGEIMVRMYYRGERKIYNVKEILGEKK